MKYLIFLSQLIIFCITFPVLAQPAQVIIIRHAEKPPTGNELSITGNERSFALVPFFMYNSKMLEHGSPVAIYAQKPGNGHPSVRPMETCTPIAGALGLKLQLFTNDHYPEMVKEILHKKRYQNKTVLICWAHGTIPDIANELGVQPKPAWPGKAFDRIWLINFGPDGKVASFQDLPQQLLFGDSPQ